MDEADAHDYAALDPDTILDAVESTGRRCDARLLALNSYENRVYQVGIEDEDPIVAKFYRPGRWSDEAIREEHHFTRQLADAELPAVAPLTDRNGETLFRFGGFRFALYPRVGGYWPELDSEEKYRRIGRLLGRLHALGSTQPFAHRPTLTIADFAEASSRFLLEHGFIPPDLETAYRTLFDDLLIRIRRGFSAAGDYTPIRLHGDFHRGNILWDDETVRLVDFDDCRMGPAVQDLWMLLEGERITMTQQLGWLLDGYRQFHLFDARQLHLIEPLRTLRMIHYSAWLARRWDDPAFPRHFPWFNTHRYWQDQILALREQAALMDEPPLEPY
ncbi:MAG: serine/threonine protein kinase [Gammaproteobacteria bacterium]